MTDFSNLETIENLIKDVPDFPKPGIIFKDITPILENGPAFKGLISHFAKKLPASTSKIVAIESRGFLLGAALSQHTDIGLVLIRKPNKLPRKTIQHSYELEYGSDTLEIHEDALAKGEKVVIIDDVLATGGTAQAAEKLCQKLEADVMGFQFLLEIPFLKGDEKLIAPHTSLFQC